MRIVTLRGITTLAILSMAFVQSARAANNMGAILLRPTQNAKVERVSEVFGRVLTPGWPVVMVRADQPDCSWWSQEWSQRTTPGHFKAQVRFGNEKTPSGRRFHVVVLMASSEEDARRLQPGTSLEQLPAGMPQSAEITVVLDDPEDRIDKIPGVIQTPEAESQVEQITPVLGCTEHKGQPTLLIRSDEPNSPWWVQVDAELAEDGRFRVMGRFGNAKTAPGTRFRMLVLFPTAKQALSLTPGKSIKDLPKDVARSAEVEVIRADLAVAAKPSTTARGEE